MMRLIHGDCLVEMKGIVDASVDLIVTDPPYGVGFVSNYRKAETRFSRIANDDQLDWLDGFMDECLRVLKPDSSVYMFCSWHKVDVFKAAFERCFTLKNILVWVKNNTGMGDLSGSYAPKYEMVLYGHKGRDVLRGGRMPDVIECARVMSQLHPTEKNVELLRVFIEQSSQAGDVVLDPFMGSGTTGVACADTGRSFIGIEIDEGYFGVCQRRQAGVRGMENPAGGDCVSESTEGQMELSLF